MVIFLPIALTLLVAASQQVTNPEDMGKRFERAQRLMAGGDFAGARQAYEGLLAVPDQVLLRASRVRVTIDEREVGLQEAARYQLANMARKQAQLARKEAALADSLEADSLETLTREKLREAAERFAALRDEEGFELRETAAYMAVDCRYEAGDFAEVVEAGRILLTRFPDSRYELRTQYTLGWAYFQMEDFAEAAEVFRAYVAQDSGSVRADRARLQWGLALEKLERWEEALVVLAELAEAYDPAGMSFEEKTQVALAGLREGQSRRSLAAKAWIKRGDVLKELGRFEEALGAYRKVGESFPEEQTLAENAWVRQALLTREAEGVDAALAVYRYATEKAERMGFRARMQAGLMSLLFEEGRYREALDAHRLYLDVYGDVTGEAGVSVDEARFRVAECLRYIGERAEGDSAGVWLEKAVREYGEVLELPESYLVPEALFWQGYTWQELGRVDSAQVAYERVYEDHPASALGCRAALQQARLGEDRSDSLYARLLEECGEEEEVRAFAALELGHRRRVAGAYAEAQILLTSIAPEFPQYVHARMELAQLRMQTGEIPAARKILEGLLEDIEEGKLQAPVPAQVELSGSGEEDELRASVQAQLGRLVQQEGDHGQALELLEAALPHLNGEMRVSVRFGIGWSRFQQKEYDKAWAAWSTGLREETLDGEQRRTYLRGLGLCARELGDAERAVALYQEMIRDEGTRVEGRLGLGQFYLDSGEGEKATTILRELEGVEEADVDLQARLLLGKALLAQERFAEAREVLRGGLALTPDSTLSAEFHFELGSAALGMQEYEEAREAFATALRQTGRRELRAAALYYLGHSLQALGEEKEAVKRFAELVETFPDQPYAPEAAWLMGEQCYREQDFAGALVWYQQVFSRWPESAQVPEALYGAGWCCLERGEEAEMREYFLRLARDFPEHERAHQGLLHLGDYYYNGQSFAKASQLYEQVVTRFPQTQEAVQARQVLLYLSDVEADSLYREGMAWFDAQEYEHAIAVLQQVIATYPGTPSEAAARCNIGVAYQQMQEYRKAAVVYRDAVRVLEDREEEWRALAFARENLAWIARNILRAEPEEVLVGIRD